MPASSVTSLSPIGSETKLRCFWLVVILLVKELLDFLQP